VGHRKGENVKMGERGKGKKGKGTEERAKERR